MNEFDFETVSPESLGFDNKHLINMVNRLDREKISMHSIIVMRHGKICMETYYEPYTKDTLHRMFSVTKSFVGIAIGILADKNMLSLDDKIVDYFKEELPEEGPHPYLSMLTIRNMLSMQTCYDFNAYKAEDMSDWVHSFFNSKPNHVPGTSFCYDTASTNVLCCLVNKLSGMNCLDFLRKEFLDEIGFSKDAILLKEPSGKNYNGGSGLCATPRDLLRVIYTLSKDGFVNNKQLLPKDFIKEATSFKSSTSLRQSTYEEKLGYGYQIWLTRDGGYAMFGMAGQLAVYLPKKDIILVTTADTMGVSGGVQRIYDVFFEEVYDKCLDTPLAESNEFESFKTFEQTRKLIPVEGEISAGLIDKLSDKTVVFDNLDMDFKDFKLEFNGSLGSITYTLRGKLLKLDFGLGYNVVQTFPEYGFKCAASAAFKSDSCLLIYIQIIDSTIGNIHMEVSCLGDYATLTLRYSEETFFKEYQGTMSGLIK